MDDKPISFPAPSSPPPPAVAVAQFPPSLSSSPSLARARSVSRSVNLDDDPVRVRRDDRSTEGRSTLRFIACPVRILFHVRALNIIARGEGLPHRMSALGERGVLGYYLKSTEPGNNT